MSLVEYARTWAEHDPDPLTRDEVLGWIEAGNEAALSAAFAGPLAFGTAGLRAAAGSGAVPAAVLHSRPNACSVCAKRACGPTSTSNIPMNFPSAAAAMTSPRP